MKLESLKELLIGDYAKGLDSGVIEILIVEITLIKNI